MGKKSVFTKEERTARKMAYKRFYEKRKLERSKADPEKLARVRRIRREASYRWRNKMKSDNPERYAEYVKSQSAKEKERRRSDPQRRIAGILRTQVYVAIRRKQMGFKSANTSKLSGCSIEEFMRHIETTWQPGMSWDNLGKGVGRWSLDHIKPCASFDLTVPEQQLVAFHFSNVRAMWFTENCSKSSHWNGKHWKHADHACQPALTA